jgi:para-aminobenzoate synthetase component 1
LSAAPIVRQEEIDAPCTPATVCRAQREQSGAALWFDGSGGFTAEGWLHGPLVALGTTRPSLPAGTAAVDELACLVAGRRREGGTAETGVAVVIGYELFAAREPEISPRLLAWTVDRSVRWIDRDRLLVTSRAGAGRCREELDAVRRAIASACVSVPGDELPEPARATGAARTSLPRSRYVAAVERVLRHIREGDVYQANVCQRLDAPYRGDPLALYVELAAETPAPRSAFCESGGVALASLSPETFLQVSRAGRIETRPIKGTRPRGATADEDRARAEELLLSAKDRAELLMIVDLERNDLSRVCRPGTVRVPDLARLRTYAAVHHLEATVQGDLRDDVGVAELIRATFPGGSISGAPKERAMEILAEVEPVARGFFTGSLIWLGDDGRVDSSILIRTLVFDHERVRFGAGGGIVADSVPEREWEESNHKVRALARRLGFEPEEAA